MQKPNLKGNPVLALITAIYVLLAATILTKYPGVVGVSFKVGPTSGHVTIDGRRLVGQPQLPEAN